MISTTRLVLLVSVFTVFPLEAVGSTTEKRCYTVDLTGYFNTPGGVNITISEARAKLQALVGFTTMLMPLDSRCWYVTLTLGQVFVNPGQVTTIGATLIFSADSGVSSNQVASTVSGCITAVKGQEGSLINVIKITNSQGASVPMASLTTSAKKSCCGKSPPPCMVTSSSSALISPSTPINPTSSFTMATGNLWHTFYVIKRCYKVKISVFYKIPGGVALTENDVHQKLAPLLQSAQQFLPLLPPCSSVALSAGQVSVSPPHVTNVELAAYLILTAQSSVPDSQVNSRLSGCMSSLRSLQSHLTSTAPIISVNGTTYQATRGSVSNGESCCKPNPPPCTLVMSTRVGPVQTPVMATSVESKVSTSPLTQASTVTDKTVVKATSTRPSSTSTVVATPVEGKVSTSPLTQAMTTTPRPTQSTPIQGNLWHTFYVIKRCYKVKISVLYNIPGGVALTEADVHQKLAPLLQNAQTYLPLLAPCSSVALSAGQVSVSPPHVTNVELAAYLILTAQSSVPDNQVNSRLSGCMSSLRSLQSHLISAAPTISVNGTTYQATRGSVSNGESCCSPNPPPCTLVMSTRVGPVQTPGPEISSLAKTYATSVTFTSSLLAATSVKSKFSTSPLTQASTATDKTVVKATSTRPSSPSTGNLWHTFYVIKRCYKVKISVFYKIPGGVALTEADVHQKLAPLLQNAQTYLPLLAPCSSVALSAGQVSVSPPHVTNVELAAYLILTAQSSVPDNQVNSRLSGCMSSLRSLQSHLISAAPTISVNGTTYQATRGSVSNGESCCKPNPPPCTLVMSTRVGPVQTPGPEISSLARTYANSVTFTSSPLVATSVKSKVSTSPLTQAMTTTPRPTQSTPILASMATDKTVVTATSTRPSSTSTVVATSATSKVSTSPLTQAMTTTPRPTQSTPIQDLEKRCYTVQVNVSLQASGPFNLTVSDIRTKLQSTFGSASAMLALIPSCKDVSFIMGDIAIFPPGDRTVKIGSTLIFSADGQVPRDEVSSRVTGCISHVRRLKGLLTTTMGTIAVKGVRYKVQNIDTSKEKSCCGDLKPPCFASDQVEIVYFSPNVFVDSGEDLVVSCRVKNPSPHTTVSWERRGIRVPVSGGTSDASQRVRVRDGSLVIAGVTTKDAGVYTCVASGRFESAMRNLTVHVNISQRLEVSLTLSSETYNSDLEDNNSKRYQELASRVTQETETMLKGEVKGFDRVEVLGFRKGSVIVDFLVITVLQVDEPADQPPDDVRHEIERSIAKHVQAGNIGKLSVMPDSLVLKVRPPPPTNIAIKDKKADEIHLEWNHPENHETYRIQAYMIRFYRSDRPNEPHNTSVPGSRRDVVLKELERGTEYEIRLSSSNMKGEGRLSGAIRVTTLTNDQGTHFSSLLLKILLPLAAVCLVVIVLVAFYCWRKRSRNKKKETAGPDDYKIVGRKELFYPNPTYG